MKRKELLNALALHKSIVPRNCKSIPVLQNILLQAADGILTIISTNLEQTAKSMHSGKTVDFADSLVNFKKLEAVVKNSESEIHLGWQNGKLFVNSIALPTESADDFPEIDFILASKKANAADFETLKRLTPFASTNEPHATLMGVLIEKDGTVVACDGRRLAYTKTGLKPRRDVIMPVAFINLASKLAGDNLQIGFQFPAKKDTESNPLACVTDGTFTVQTKCIVGQYPNWKRVLPEAPFAEVEFFSNKLLAPIKQYNALLRAADSKDEVILSFDDDRFIRVSNPKDNEVEFLQAESWESAKKIDTVKTGFNGHWPACVNPRYLQDILTLHGDQIVKCSLFNTFDCNGDECVLQMSFTANKVNTLLMAVRSEEATLHAEAK